MFKQKILGLDLGTNSVGWALLEGEDGIPKDIIDAGCRIFNKSVEEKTPIPKNATRREKRLARRVLQRRSRRKKRMLNFLVKIELLPEELKHSSQPEIILNSIGDPYYLRSKALDDKLSKHELGRVFLHLVQRRGFLSNKKTILGDMVDDPDVQSVLDEEESTENGSSKKTKEETAFKKDIAELKEQIKQAKCRTLGEYLASLTHHECKRNRIRNEGNLRTDRQMYKDELDLIWHKQNQYYSFLNPEKKEQIEEIIFFQRPLRHKPGRQGNCSLEVSRKRARMGRLEVQKFRYLQDINNLQYREPHDAVWLFIKKIEREKLIELFETNTKPSFAKIKSLLKLNKKTEFNLETDQKNLKGNTTACKIREVLPVWDEWTEEKQYALVEDMITINKKSVLKKRLIDHWGFETQTAVKLCMIEFEPGHSSLSSKAIKRLLPFLLEGQIYSDARISAGYGYEDKKNISVDRLGPPPEIPNPIVSRGLHELRRVVNALIAHHGKPDVIRLEMARDLEMNTQRYKKFIQQQEKNKKANAEAEKKYQEMRTKNPHLHLSSYPSKEDKIRYRLWIDQDQRCAYSNNAIPLVSLFSSEIEIDHIIPYSQSLDDSYMNRVLCYAGENRYKGQRTPIDAFGGNTEKWNQIGAAIEKWPRQLRSKRDRFYISADKVRERDFINSQLTDTRYISKEALNYLKSLGSDVSTTKGFLVSWMRHLWGLNSVIGEHDKKERSDHRHHTIDAIVVGCIDRKFHKRLVKSAKETEAKGVELKTNRLGILPPWVTIADDTEAILNKIIISYSPQKKLSGALHEDTGAGFIEGKGTVYRKDLNGNFKIKQVKKIVDEEVRKIVANHLRHYDNKPKDAFAQGITLYHKDGITPIKRVRTIQAKTTANKLLQSKFGVKNSQGETFKWMAYGNIHHVEIIQNKKTGSYSEKFITMMEAHRRAMTNTSSAQKRGTPYEPIIQKYHDENHLFVMALHKNDIVSINKKGGPIFYRVQAIDSPNKRIKLRLHTSAKNNPHETLSDGESTIPALMARGLKLRKLNAIGKILDD